MIKRGNKTSFFLLIVLIMFVVFAVGVTSTAKAYASDIGSADSQYTLGAANGSYAFKDAKRTVYNAREGAAYTVKVVELYDYPIEQIFYSAYKVEFGQEDLSRDDEGNIIQELSKDNSGNEIKNIQLDLSALRANGTTDRNGSTTMSFEVTGYEWCAFVFTIIYKERDIQTLYDVESEPLYCTVIDSSFPHMEIYDGPIYRDGGFMYTVKCRSDSLSTSMSSLSSGFGKIRVYRKVGDGPEETIETITDFTNRISNSYVYVEVLVLKGEYFIEVTDGVGNMSKGSIGKLDFDPNETIRINNIEDVLNNTSELYTNELISTLRTAYLSWQILGGSSDSTEQQISDARDAALDALTACYEARTAVQSGAKHKVKILNGEGSIYGDISVTNFNYTTYKNVLFGNEAMLQIALASYEKAGFFDEAFLKQAGIKNPERILTLDVSILEKKQAKFVDAVGIKIPLSTEYINAEAYAVTEKDGAKTYTKLSIDKTSDAVTVYVPDTHAKIYFLYQTEEAANKKLYWLFTLLIIPIGGAVALLVFLKKRKGKGSTQK